MMHLLLSIMIFSAQAQDRAKIFAWAEKNLNFFFDRSWSTDQAYNECIEKYEAGFSHEDYQDFVYHSLRNKYKAKAILKKHGVNGMQVVQDAVADTSEDFEDFLKKMLSQLPEEGLILKPTTGLNSIGVSLVTKNKTGFDTYEFHTHTKRNFKTEDDVVSYVINDLGPRTNDYKNVSTTSWFVERKQNWKGSQPLEIRINGFCGDIVGFWISHEGYEYTSCVAKNGSVKAAHPGAWHYLMELWGEDAEDKFRMLFEDFNKLYHAFHPYEMSTTIPFVRLDFFAHSDARNGKYHSYNEGGFGLSASLVEKLDDDFSAWIKDAWQRKNRRQGKAEL